VYLLAYEVSTRLMVTTAFIGAVMVFIGTLLATLGAVILESGLAALPNAADLFPRFAVEGAISAVFAPVIFALLGGLKRLTGLPVGPARE